jgi:hypothetical protein
MAKGYKNLEDDDTNDEEEWARKEKRGLARVADHITRKGAKDPPNPGYEPCAELHGSWAEFTVDMVEDWTNLYNAAMDKR